VATFLLQREQWLPRPVEEVFAFFADAGSLEAITPPWLHFHILTPRPIALRARTLIQYRLRWRGLALRWLTEIAEWEPSRRFVDRQLRGPYTLWHHSHEFEPYQGGTRMRDEVRYALPLGPVGRLMHRLFVRRDLDAIFDYRAKKVGEMFGEAPASRGSRPGCPSITRFGPCPTAAARQPP
jgi:ligand-binding SRPBCC domain-containing protein